MKPTRRHRFFTVVVGAVLAICINTSISTNAWPQPQACAFDAQALLEQVNLLRSEGAQCGARGAFVGVAPLAWNDAGLREMALMQASFLSNLDDLRHAGPNGQTIADRAHAADYRFARVAENLALGHRSVAHVLRAWTVSDTHCANLYDSRFTEVAVVCQAGKGNRPLWVMVLGRPRQP
jgi:uncharacterized protein YkwD